MLSEIAASAEELATRPDTPASIAELMLMVGSVLAWVSACCGCRRALGRHGERRSATRVEVGRTGGSRGGRRRRGCDGVGRRFFDVGDRVPGDLAAVDGDEGGAVQLFDAGHP